MTQHVEDILAGGPLGLTQWLDQAELRGLPAEDIVRLPALAWGSAQIARSTMQSDSFNSLSWACAAIRAYEMMPQYMAQPGIRHSAMMLRAAMIASHGPKADDPVRDPRILEDWFYEIANLPRDEVARNAEECRQRMSQGNITSDSGLVTCLSDLRNLKNALSVLEAVGNPDVFLRSADIRNWIGMKGELP
jgi:hypothetical protein